MEQRTVGLLQHQILALLIEERGRQVAMEALDEVTDTGNLPGWLRATMVAHPADAGDREGCLVCGLCFDQLARLWEKPLPFAITISGIDRLGDVALSLAHDIETMRGDLAVARDSGATNWADALERRLARLIAVCEDIAAATGGVLGKLPSR